MLVDERPMDLVAGLLRKLMELFENAKYNAVLPTMTAEMEAEADRRAAILVDAHKGNWRLIDRRPRRAGSAKGMPDPPDAPKA